MRTKRLLGAFFTAILIFASVCSVLADEALAGQDEITVNPEGTNTSLDTAYPITEFRVTDSLPERDAVRFYSFELTEDCTPIIYMTNESTSAYSFCWYMTIYSADGETVIKEGAVEGRGNNTVLPLELSAGKYYIKISTPTTGNPMTNGYSSDSYTLFVVFPSEHRTQDANGITTVENSGTWICALDGIVFRKLNSEPAYAAIFHGPSGGNFTFLILVGETNDSALYTSDTADYIPASAEKIKYGGKVYYYYVGLASNTANALVEDEMSPQLYLCTADDAKGAAKEILGLAVDGEAPSETFFGSVAEYFKDHWIMIVSGVVGVIIFMAILGGGGEAETSSASSSSAKSEEEELLEYCNRCKSDGTTVSSFGSGYSTSTSTNDDMDLIEDMSRRLNNPGYEPDGWGTGGIPGPEDPGPDPESFPDSSDIY